MKAYSMDLRERVLAACDAGEVPADVAERFDVSASWVRRLQQRRREGRGIAPRPRGGARGFTIDRTRLAELVRATPDATLEEFRAKLGVTVTLSAIWKALHALKISWKKSRWSPRSGTAPTWRRGEPSGCSGGPGSIRVGSCSSTKHGQKRT